MTLTDLLALADRAFALLGALGLLMATLATILPKSWRVTYWLSRGATDLRGVVEHHGEVAASKRVATVERDHVFVTLKTSEDTLPFESGMHVESSGKVGTIVERKP